MEKLQFQQKFPIVLISSQIEEKACNERNQELFFASIYLSICLTFLLLDIFKQKVNSREYRLHSTAVLTLLVSFAFTRRHKLIFVETFGVYLVVLLASSVQIVCNFSFLLLDILLTSLTSLLYNFFVIFFILRQSVQTKHRQNVHVNVIDHQTNVAQTARSFDRLRFKFSPKNQIYENFCNFFQSFQVYVLRAQTGDNDRIEALLINYLLQILLIFG